jgi:Domain of unknown function (DUF5916)/Carbohydrate family 9 binding domain-like
MSRQIIGVVGLLVAFGAGRALAQTGSVHATPPREVRAVRVQSGIHLDGKLDEPAWQTAPAATGFRQSQPEDGKPATQRTEVRFLFDGAAIYIGARMFDSLGAEGVRTRLVRRDGSADADKLTVVFDTYHDHLGTTEFSVNPSGVRWDASGLGGSAPDDSWDPVWEVKTRIDSVGWTAEIRIPFAQLRYPTAPEQTWGLQVVRLEARLNERSNWVWWPLNQAGGPERFGHLTGLEIERKPGRLEVLPYVVGRSTNMPVTDSSDPFADAHRLGSRVGADIKYLLTSNLTLTATVNPDFGQVEVDPAVVNLSAFETYFEERRPFFIEGSGYFRFGGLSCNFCSNVSGLSLFYPRRIGRQPQGASRAYDTGPYASIPESSTILGAAKITGRTPSGWSVGVMNAMTRREFATVQLADATRASVQVEPFTNYFVGRLAKDLRGGATVLSGMATSMVRDLADSGLAGLLNRHAEGMGFEQVSYFKQRTYTWRMSVAFSQIAGEPSAILRAQRSSARYFQRPDRTYGGNALFTDRYDSTLTALRGWALYSRFAKQSGDWMFETGVNARSPGFEVNDIAYLSRADYVWMNANVLRQFVKPTRWYRQLFFIAGGQQQYNFDGDVTQRQVQAYGSIEPPNYWNVSSFVIYRPRVFDDEATRGGPVVQRAGLTYEELDISTDSRKNLVLQTGSNHFCTEEGACGVGLSLTAQFRPVSNLSLSVGPAYSYEESRAQYVTAADDGAATDFYGRRYIFSDLAQKELSMNTRINVTFTPSLTLEVFAQPLLSSGKYSNYKEFVAPRGLEKRVFDDVTEADGVVTVDPDGAAGPAAPISFDQPDFTFRSLRGNAVLRWEYKSGSTLYFVWTQSRANQQPLGDLAVGRDVGRLFDAPAENVFLVKASYWLGW